jgi:thioester reductase-like protein
VGTDNDSQRRARIAELVEKYTKDLPQTRVTEFRRDGNRAVILIGSTRLLGNYILSELTKDPTISKIYCLNRSDDTETRQVKGFEGKGLEIPPNFVSRVEFFPARFGSEKLGLPDQVYEKLKKSVGTIIHNA